MIPRPVVLVLALTAVGSAPIQGQKVRIGLHSVAMTHTEVREGLGSQGVGGGATLAVRFGRLGLEARAVKARFDPDSAGLEEFDLTQWDTRLSFWVASFVALEVGGGRRTIEPEFSAQDVGAVRVGFVSEYPLASIASVRVRGAYLADPKFNGGGEATLAVEIGLGVAVGTSNGRFRVRADAEFQRIDREVNHVEVPIQVTLAGLGIEIGLW